MARVDANALIGVWRSLVAHLHGVQGVGGSNPLTPINTEMRLWAGRGAAW
jgi:hypothetical protein